jgi:hypothetical protein
MSKVSFGLGVGRNSLQSIGHEMALCQLRKLRAENEAENQSQANIVLDLKSVIEFRQFIRHGSQRATARRPVRPPLRRRLQRSPAANMP